MVNLENKININTRNKVILVDEQDNIIGTEDKLKAHQLGLLHRAFSVMLYRYNKNSKKIEFLLQKRAYNKYHCAGLWSNTCCSHPQPESGSNSNSNSNSKSNTDNIKISAESSKSRLKEELLDINIDNINLKYINNFIYKAKLSNNLIEHEYDYVFIAEYNNTPGFFNKDEITELSWFDIDYIKNDLGNYPDKYTPWFKQVLNLILEYEFENEFKVY